ncbi:MAG TPA: hypothetical protein VMF68_12225 [Spirochaetia bacterium]|nr:hypothetical protein [Spirochaetia bacterium]
MILLLVLLACLSPTPAQAETITAIITVTPDAVGTPVAAPLPSAADLQAGVRRLFNLQMGSIVTLDTSGSSPAARVTVSGSPDRVTVSTDFTRAGATRSLVSTLPRGSPASLVATATGDISFLYFASRGFSTLPLSAPPALSAVLSTDALALLTGWNRDELEPISLAASGDEVTVGFPHRYLTLGPRFSVTASTIRDLDAQALGKEPLQLSGLVPGPGDLLFLLSERTGSIVTVDRALGTRTVSSAPGLSALPARRAGVNALVGLGAAAGTAGLVVYPEAGAAPPAAIHVAASYLSALDVDGEGNFWAWDAGERRLRVITPGGREVYAIRPLFSAATMPLPQALAVLDDGSFILAGSGEIWKFLPSGIPAWRLARIPGRPGESLPASFDLCVNRAGGAVTILDQQSRRLVAFASPAAAGSDRLSALLSRLDTRKFADLREAARQALAEGLGLMAWQLGDQEARAGGSEADRTQARIQLLSARATGFAARADELSRGLLLERADSALVRAAAALREWTAEAPTDAAAAALLSDVQARRRETRAALLGSADLRVLTARLDADYSAGCRPALRLVVQLANRGAQAAAGVRLHAAVPAAAESPALAAVDGIPGGGQAELSLPLGAAAAALPRGAAALAGFALVTWQRGSEGASSAFTFPVQLDVAAPRDLAAELACRAIPQDTLAAGLGDSLVSGTRATSPQPLVELAGVLDALGAARAVGTGALPSSPLPSSTRSALRGLSPDSADWAVAMASVASSLGLGAAIVTRADRVLAAVDTGIPFFTALEAVPGLARFQAELAAISPGGTLWVPLSPSPPPPGQPPSAWEIADGLRALRDAGALDLGRAEVPASTDAPNAAVPFPLVLPSVTARSSEAALRAEISAALQQVP